MFSFSSGSSTFHRDYFKPLLLIIGLRLFCILFPLHSQQISPYPSLYRRLPSDMISLMNFYHTFLELILSSYQKPPLTYVLYIVPSFFFWGNFMFISFLDGVFNLSCFIGSFSPACAIHSSSTKKATAATSHGT